MPKLKTNRAAKKNNIFLRFDAIRILYFLLLVAVQFFIL